MRQLMIRGARLHNLKNIDVSIPKDALTVAIASTPAGRGRDRWSLLQEFIIPSVSAWRRGAFPEEKPNRTPRIAPFSPHRGSQRADLGLSCRAAAGPAALSHPETLSC